MPSRRPPSTPPNLSFRQAVGAQIRKLREERGVHQEIVAMMGRRWGLAWASNTVAQLETGRRRLATEEWLLLPAVLTRALHPAEPYTWGDLVPDAKVPIFLTGQTAAYSTSLQELAHRGGQIRKEDEEGFDTPERRHRQKWMEIEEMERRQRQRKKQRGKEATVPPDMISDGDRRAARALSVPPSAIVLASRRLWRRPLMEEREFRLIAASYEMAPPRRAQALRGVITRDLLTDLRRTMRKMGLRPKPAGRPGRPKKGGKS